MGEWLPEPLVTTGDGDPVQQAEVADSLSMAFLLLLESLSPEQRAVFLLREVFDYPYDRIAEIVARASRAPASSPCAPEGRWTRAGPASRRRRRSERLAERFFAATREGDLGALEALLAEDVHLHGDGGGKVPALARAVRGRLRVARTLVAWSRAGARFGPVTVRREEVNGQPGGVVLDSAGRVISLMVLEIAEGRIEAVRSVVNPDKLRHLGPVADVNKVLRGR